MSSLWFSLGPWDFLCLLFHPCCLCYFCWSQCRKLLWLFFIKWWGWSSFFCKVCVELMSLTQKLKYCFQLSLYFQCTTLVITELDHLALKCEAAWQTEANRTPVTVWTPRRSTCVDTPEEILTCGHMCGHTCGWFHTCGHLYVLMCEGSCLHACLSTCVSTHVPQFPQVSTHILRCGHICGDMHISSQDEFPDIKKKNYFWLFSISFWKKIIKIF